MPLWETSIGINHLEQWYPQILSNGRIFRKFADTKIALIEFTRIQKAKFNEKMILFGIIVVCGLCR